MTDAGGGLNPLDGCRKGNRLREKGREEGRTLAD